MDAVGNLNLGALDVWIAFTLTLMVFSYIFGDNPLFRLAEHLFVGVAAGYIVVLVYHTILAPRLLLPLAQAPAEHLHLLVPLLLGLLLLAKGRRTTSWMGNMAMALLFGVGTALALGGALLGTLGTQVRATWVSLNPADYSGTMAWVNAVLIVAGTIGVLLYFYFTGSTGRGVGRLFAGIRAAWGRLGYWFILIAFGALFAGTMIARFSLLVDRVRFLLETLGLFAG